MKSVPRYTKVLAIGSAMTGNALTGEVVIQEKVDGSQFRFGVNQDGEIVMGSKGLDFEGRVEKMFLEAWNHIMSKEGVMKVIAKDYDGEVYLYAEYLRKPKHNTLSYGNIPQNHLVLFDGMGKGSWLSRKELESIAKALDIDLIPELFRGEATTDTIKEFLTSDSFLGKEKMEGVVIKNYNQSIMLGGMVLPLFTKYVREDFKERNHAEWSTKKPRNNLDLYTQSFKSEARWVKAVQHLRDAGKLEESPRDIGKLIPEVQKDIIEEESENIKNELYKLFIDDIQRAAIGGLPQWYKERLLNNVNQDAIQHEGEEKELQ